MPVLLGLLLPAGLQAQARDVVSKQVSVGASASSLVLEFRDGEDLEVSVRDGTVAVDDRALGSIEPGSPLDASWRALLGQAVALENGPLATALVEWSPPEGLSGTQADVARALDTALEEALESPAAPVENQDGSVSISLGDGEGQALARLLTGSLTRLSLLEEALDDLGPSIRVHIEEDYELPEGERVEGTVVVIEGEARIAGEIDGDLVVVDGTVELEETGLVTGQLRVADARVVRNLGTVDGGIVDVLEDERNVEEELRERLRTEIRDEIRSDLRRELRNVTRSADDEGFSLLSPFRSVIRGVGGIIEKAFIVLVLGLLGAVAVSFAGTNLDVVAETARRAPGRAAAVGLAGTFLLIPVWVLGAVALVVSIVGIPVAIAWLPLFPAAVAVAALFGYLAVAHNAGGWLADSGYPWTDWIRKSNPVHTIFAGLIGLVLAFVAADLISILPFFGFLSGLLVFFGSVLTFVAVQVGLGAVLLTRGGRRREYWGMDPDEAWAAAMDLDEEPATAGSTTGTDTDADTTGGPRDV